MGLVVVGGGGRVADGGAVQSCGSYRATRVQFPKRQAQWTVTLRVLLSHVYLIWKVLVLLPPGYPLTAAISSKTQTMAKANIRMVRT